MILSDDYEDNIAWQQVIEERMLRTGETFEEAEAALLQAAREERLSDIAMSKEEL